MSETAETRPDEQGFDYHALTGYAERLVGFGGWSYDVRSGEIFWTAELFSMFGYDSAGGAPSYEVALSLYPEDQRPMVDRAVQACITDGVPMNLESVIIDRAGREMNVRIVGEPFLDDAGATVRIQGAFYDISEVIDEREKRIAAQEELRATLDHLPDFVTFIDANWRVTFANIVALTLAGVPTDQIYSETIWDLFPKFWTPALRALYERAMVERVGGEARDYLPEYQVWVEAVVYPTEHGVASFVRDVSDEERRAQSDRDVGERLKDQAALLDASRQAIFTEDLDNVVTYWNQGAEETYGWSKEEAMGRNIRELIYEDVGVFEERIAELMDLGRWRGDMNQRTKDGRQLIVDCTWQVVYDERGLPAKIFAINADVTEVRRRQELQSRAQRMESLGTLAGGVAHDLNNVLTPLLISVQLLRSFDPKPDTVAILEGMEIGIKRGADMISQVVSFARGVDGQRDRVDIADVLRELSTLSLQTLPKSIEVTLDIDDAPTIVGDATQVLQVLMNLVSNACDVMPDGGSLSVAVHRETMSDERADRSFLAPGDYASISVEDSGSGMPPEILDKIFEPFFTTKEQGKGTGLGLASSMAIARSHGGTITAYSEAGVGSRLVLYLPMASSQSRPAQSPTAGTQLPTGAGELVLVVDDEASIRRMVRLTLEAHGYRTVEASNGREAIEVFTSHTESIQLVLTDMMMPVMDGAATAAYFFEHHPDVAIVAASGLNANGGVVRASHAGVNHFVSKPFTTETLLRTLHEALRGPL